jgi:hypothetical protein
MRWVSTTDRLMQINFLVQQAGFSAISRLHLASVWGSWRSWESGNIHATPGSEGHPNVGKKFDEGASPCWFEACASPSWT